MFDLRRQKSALEDLKLSLVNGNVEHDLEDIYTEVIKDLTENSMESNLKIMEVDIVNITLRKLIKAKRAFKDDNVVLKFIFENFSDTSNVLNLKLLDLLKMLTKSKYNRKWVYVGVDNFRNFKSYILGLEVVMKSDANLVDFYNTHQLFIYQLFDNFEVDQLANCSAKLLIVIYKNLHVNQNDDANSDIWYESWRQIVVINLNNSKRIKNMLTYLLPKLFSIDSTPLTRFLSHFDLKIQLELIKIGHHLDIPLTSLTPDISLFIDQESILCLQMLCFSVKTSDPVHQSTFELLQRHLVYIIKECDPFELVDILNKFLIRIKDSCNNLARKGDVNYLNTCKNFILWLININITPNSLHSLVFVYFKVLQKLSTLQLVFEPVVYTSKTIGSLLDQLHSNYKDIRALAVELLSQAPDLSFTQTDINQGIIACMDLKQDNSDIAVDCFKVVIPRLSTPEQSNLLKQLLDLLKNATNCDLSQQNHRVHGIPSIIYILYRQGIGGRDGFQSILKYNRLISAKILPDSSDKQMSRFSWKYLINMTELVTFLLTKFGDKSDTEEYVKLLVSQIFSINHRGTLLSISPFLADILNDQVLAKQVLDDSITFISKPQLTSRRSGGLPLIISQILLSHGEFLSGTFVKLFEIIESPSMEYKGFDLPQVNGFNIVTAIFREHQIPTSNYILKALVVCLTHFQDIWTIRNSAMMLFASVHHKLSVMESIDFFDQVDMNLITKYLRSHDASLIIPVLLILQKLRFNDNDLYTIQPILFELLLDTNWKIRQLTAQMFVVSTTNNKRMTLANELIDKIDATNNTNSKHGMLLAVLELLKSGIDVDIDKLPMFTNWGLLTVYVKCLKYKPLECLKSLTNLKSLFLNNMTCKGIKKLAICELLEYLLYQGQYDIIPHIKDYNLTLIVLEHLCKELPVLKVNLNIPTIDNYSLLKLLELKIHYKVPHTGELTDNDEINARLLRLIPFKHDHVSWYKTYSRHEIVDIRLHTLKALECHFKQSFPLTLLLFKYFEDDDKLIRNHARSILTVSSLQSLIKTFPRQQVVPETIDAILDLVNFQISEPTYMDQSQQIANYLDILGQYTLTDDEIANLQVTNFVVSKYTGIFSSLHTCQGYITHINSTKLEQFILNI